MTRLCIVLCILCAGCASTDVPDRIIHIQPFTIIIESPAQIAQITAEWGIPEARAVWVEQFREMYLPVGHEREYLYHELRHLQEYDGNYHTGYSNEGIQ